MVTGCEDAFDATCAGNRCILCTIVSVYPGDLLVHLSSYAVLARRMRDGRAGAFEHAAGELRVDRSVLRRRMSTLATWVGAPLFRGRGAALEPTELGQRLLERAERMLADADTLASDVKQGRERIVIGCTGTITTEVLPRVLVDLEKKRRDVQLLVRRAGGAAAERMVRSGDLDVGIVRISTGGDRARPADLWTHDLGEDRLWWVVPAAHPLACARQASLAGMAEVPLILYGESSRTRARVMERLGPLGASIRVEIDGRAAALEYVRLGLGASFVSLLAGHRARWEGVAARDVTGLFAPTRFCIIARPERQKQPTVRELVDLVIATAARGRRR
jgi:DNA-binding transcriptional LysR family regulator